MTKSRQIGAPAMPITNASEILCPSSPYLGMAVQQGPCRAGPLQKVYHGGLPWDLRTVFFFACTSISRVVKVVVVLESPGRENVGRGDNLSPDIFE